MEFIDIVSKYENFDFDNFLNSVTLDEVEDVLKKEKLNELDFLKLLSPAAKPKLEDMAKKSRDLTRQHFGYTIGLYMPLYISNFCTNNCLYCGFSTKNKISRKKLTLEEIAEEANIVLQKGVEHILLLAGEAEKLAGIDYVIEAVKILKKKFASIHIEIFPTTEENYKRLYEAGVDGLTIYQETYDKELYKKVHLSGQKSDYMFRLLTPERGAKAGFRAVNIGALYGLGDVVKEAFFSALHAKYLMDKYLETEFSISLPRINSAEGNFKPYEILDDIRFVQFMSAFRIFLPKLGINISTRESASFRDNILELGVTRFSAGSKTEVGGYSKEDKSTAQFDISDKRETDEVISMLHKRGFQPVLKDWGNDGMKIAIAGAGGIGSNIAMNLVRSGVKELSIYDFDKIEKSNLNRQFYFEDQIDKFKVEALKENLLRIDSTCKIDIKVIKIDSSNIKELFDDAEIIVEAFDKAEYKSLLVSEYLNSDKFIVAASGIADCDLESVEIREFGRNCMIVGDFKKDIKEYKTYSSKVSYICSIMANLILNRGGFYDNPHL